MATELLKQLLEAGVHFGHQKKRWNPKMKDFCFGQKSGIYIIDLEKTVVALNKAKEFLENLAAAGEKILLVGTKRQAQDIIREEAKRCGVFYVDQRWVGGLLTNFKTVKKSINRLKEIEKMQEDGVFNVLSKKEVAGLIKEMERLRKNFIGIIDMEQLPQALYVVDTNKEKTAINEAKRLNIPVVALVDTNCDPRDVSFPIPGNDDAIKSIRTVTSIVCDSIVKGRQRFLKLQGIQPEAEPEVKEEAKPEVKEEAKPEAKPEAEVTKLKPITKLEPVTEEVKPVELEPQIEKLKPKVSEDEKTAKTKGRIKKAKLKKKPGA